MGEQQQWGEEPPLTPLGLLAKELKKQFHASQHPAFLSSILRLMPIIQSFYDVEKDMLKMFYDNGLATGHAEQLAMLHREFDQCHSFEELEKILYVDKKFPEHEPQLTTEPVANHYVNIGQA